VCTTYLFTVRSIRRHELCERLTYISKESDRLGKTKLNCGGLTSVRDCFQYITAVSVASYITPAVIIYT